MADSKSHNSSNSINPAKSPNTGMLAVAAAAGSPPVKNPDSTKSCNITSASSEIEYFAEVDKIREEMLAISQNSRFVASRESMMSDENGKIFAAEDKADKNVLKWIESVRKKIYDIAQKFNKPPREVLQQSQVLAKQTLDRDKQPQNVTKSKHTLTGYTTGT